MKNWWLLGLLCWLPLGTEAAVVVSPDPKGGADYAALSCDAAITNLARLRRMANAVTYEQLGFKSKNEVKGASNGVPMQVYQVTLARLRAYKNEPDFANLVEPTVRIIYPVLVGGEVRSSHTLRQFAGGAWQGVSWGEPPLIKALVEARASVKPVRTNWVNAPFAVEVPLVGMWLVGYRDATNRLRLIATSDWRQGKATAVKNGEINPALMESLGELARSYKGNSN